MLVIDTNGYPVYYWVSTAFCTIQALVGAFTTVKIWPSKHKDNRWFGLVISGGIAGYGASLVGV